MYLRDLEGNEYALDSSIRKSRSLNGNRSLTFVVYPTKTNKRFINEIGELWQLIDNDEHVWTIIYVAPEGRGDSLNVQVKAIPQMFDHLNTTRLYDELNEHMTAHEAFTYIFNETPYSFRLMDTFLAIQWEGFGGGKTRLEQFKDALNRYEAEFTVVGNEVRLYKQIGRDTEFMYHYKLNASNISKESDAGELWTVARGYGDYEAGGTPNLEREYRSPLADVLGERHAPPLKDGRITNVNTMDAKLKQLVDNSLKVSVKATLHDLRKQGYPLAQPELGDRVFLIDDRINLKDEMRVVDIQEVEDYEGELLNFEVTLGSEELGKRRQSEIKHALKEITDIVEGRKKLPLSALDNAIKEATLNLLNTETDVEVTENGIVMTDKNDPNKVVIANSAGIGISIDGGATFRNAITGDGINVDTIIGNTSEFVRSSWNSINGSVNIDGSGISVEGGSFKLKSPNGTLVIDGQSNMHKILATGVMNIDIPAGSVNFNASISHNLGYTPVFSAYMQGDSTIPEEDGHSFNLPRVVSAPGGDSLIVQSTIKGEATADKFFVRVRRAQNYGSALPAKTIVIRYFIYKEVAF